MCGDSSVVEKVTNGFLCSGQKFRGGIGEAQNTVHSWSRRKAALPAGKNGNYVKHSNREHNRQADHSVNFFGPTEKGKLSVRDAATQSNGRR